MAFSVGAKCSLLVALVAVPFFTNHYTAYQLGLYLLYGIVGQGIALCWGKGGFLPMGQALFFGIGAYISGAFLQSSVGWGSIVIAFLLAIILPAIIAGALGILVFGRKIGSGLYFSLITLALALLGYQLANSQVAYTGGFNGMSGIKGLPGIDSYSHLYFVIVAALVCSTICLTYLIATPFGQMLLAVRENEERLQVLGFDSRKIKAVAFAVSGGIAGLAGAFFAPHQGIVTPQVVGFILSAELVIWTAVGGRFGLIGPVVGAVLIGFLASGLRDHFAFWEVGVALVFIIVVLRMPGGICGLLASLSKRAGFRPEGGRYRQRSKTIARKTPVRDSDLEFNKVSLKIGNVNILHDLSLKIYGSGIHCLIGPNGAGKTSAFNVLTGAQANYSGQIFWRGRSLSNIRPYHVSGIGIARKLQVPSIFPELTVRQNIDLALWVNRFSYFDFVSKIPYGWRSELLGTLQDRFPFLNESAVTAGALSVGQRQILDFSMTVLSEPDLILLDEPCAGLSTSETELIIKTISELAQSTRGTFIIVEHDMQVVELLSDDVLVMHQGQLLDQGPIEAIRSNPAVQRVYSGGTKY